MSGEMDIDEAFRLLGLPVDASEDDIRRAYHELCKTTHPDAPDGDTEEQKALNTAYERASAYLKIKHAVIPINSRALTQNLRHALTL